MVDHRGGERMIVTDAPGVNRAVTGDAGIDSRMNPATDDRRASVTGPRPPVSVVILTLNEEVNIAECLASCAWSDDVHVLDSGSQDRTVEIAQRLGAHVHHHSFESFGAQRNWAIDNIPMKHDWVFHLDADERFTPELVAEMDRLLSREPREAGFLVPNKLMFMGRWLKRSAGYPTFQVRLFHKGRMRFADYGHGQREATDGKIGRIDVPYLHYSFSKGLYDWFEKHNRYSSLEAIQFVELEGRRPALADLLASDAVARRRAWKRVLYGLPMWPTIRRLATLFVLGGILEGRAGITYARLLATYEQMIQMKLRLQRNARRSGRVGFEMDVKPMSRTEITDPEAMAAGLGSQVPGAADVTGLVRGVSGPTDNLARPARVDESGHILPEASPWTLREKVLRVAWMMVGKPLFRMTFHNWYGLRRLILRVFGAKVGGGVRIRPSADVEIPWNLDLRDGAIVGDRAILYSLGKITIGEGAVISQYAHICAGTHDHTDRRFPLIRDPIVIGPGAWIGTDAFVGPKVTVGALAVLGARASAYKDLEPGMIYGGNPAKPIKKREIAQP